MSNIVELYTSSQLPVLQNRVFLTLREAKNCRTGDIVLVQDLKTGLIFNNAFNSTLIEYDEHYQNEQSFSGLFCKHLDNVTQIINKHFTNKTLLEIGCGKGFFLEHLAKEGFIISGIDPTYEGTNPSIIKDFYNPAMGLSADGLILRHVLEHIQDPLSFLYTICESNKNQGKIYIEVPSFEWICQQKTWFDIFYEHVNYFTLQDFYRIFGQIDEAGYTFGGQYIYVVAELNSIRQPIYTNDKAVEFPHNFLVSVNGLAEKLSRSEFQNKSVLWGAASKGVIFSLFMQRKGITFPFIVDINPAKQGKYLPVTGLQVYSPQQALVNDSSIANIIIMNNNYLAEIQQMTENRYNYFCIDTMNI